MYLLKILMYVRVRAVLAEVTYYLQINRRLRHVTSQRALLLYGINHRVSNIIFHVVHDVHKCLE